MRHNPEDIEMAADLAVYTMYRSHASAAAKAAFDSMPALRQVRTMALFKVGIQVAKSVWAFSQDYGGKTTRVLNWTSDPRKVGVETKSWESKTSFYTKAINGAQRPKWEGSHTLTLYPPGLIELALRPEIARASEEDGLPLLSLTSDGYATWAKFAGGKKLGSDTGWVAFKDGLVGHNCINMYLAERTLARRIEHGQFMHSAKSLAGRAKRGNKKRVVHTSHAIAHRFLRRYPKTIIRTVDARRIGYCFPGILQFQRRYKVGDNVPADVLRATGNSNAIHLTWRIVAHEIETRRGRHKKNRHKVELYNRCQDGSELKPTPEGWEIIPEGHDIPFVHRECREDYRTGRLEWCAERRGRSTMTPIWAEVSGGVRAFACKITTEAKKKIR